MGKDDLRFRKTEQAIRQAFLTLLKTNTFEDITIKEISSVANCNRNTFYLHYVDKHDLMEQLCTLTLDKMNREIHSVSEYSYSSNKEWYMKLAQISLDMVEKDRDFYMVILGLNRYPDFTEKFRTLLPDYILNHLKTHGKFSKYKSLALEFTSNGIIGVIRCWLLHPELYTKDEILKELENLAVQLGIIIFEE